MKPKLLFIADTYYPKVDGIIRFMEEFTQRCHTYFNISLLVPYLGQKKGNKVTYLSPSKMFSISGYPNLKISVSNFVKIRQAIKESDLIFVQGPGLISFLGMYYGHKYQKKTIAYVHILGWRLFGKFLPGFLQHLFVTIFKKASIRLYNLCNLVIVPYPDLKEYLQAEGVKTKMTIVGLGVNIEQFHPAEDKLASKEKIGISGQKKVIGYVGRISREKNVKTLLAAFKKLSHQQELVLLIVGDGPENQKKPFLETKNCIVTGFIDNVQDYLKAMDIFVMPSLTETTSLATLEAMASGLPVIATRIGFMQNYIVKGYNGTFFGRNDSTLLAKKIGQLLQEKELRQRLGRNARKTVAYSFSWERSINRIRRIVKRG